LSPAQNLLPLLRICSLNTCAKFFSAILSPSY